MYQRLTINVSKKTKLVAVPLFHLLLVILLNDTGFLSYVMDLNRDSKFCKICKMAEVVFENCKDWICSRCRDFIFSRTFEHDFWSNNFKTEERLLNDQMTYLLAHVCIRELHTFQTLTMSAKIAKKIAQFNFINVSSFYIKQGRDKFQTDFLKPLQFCQSKLARFTSHGFCVAPSFEENVPRLASFRSIFLTPGLGSISYVRLARAGFKYEGRQPYVRCVDCGQEISIFRFVRDENCVSDPGTTEFHANGCSFISTGLESSVSGESGETAPGASSSLTSVSTTGSRVLQIESPVPQGNSLSKHVQTRSPDKQKDRSTEYAIPAHISFPAECYRELTVATALHKATYEINGLKEMTHQKAQTVQNIKHEKVNLLQKENKKLTEQLVCKVCTKDQVRELLLPCGELVACQQCSKQLLHCPSCNVKILATVTVYFS